MTIRRFSLLAFHSCELSTVADWTITRAVVPLAFAALMLSMPMSARSQVVGSVIRNPVYVNIYWDQKWDADVPFATMNRIDDFTSALVNSVYFSGLLRFGVTSVAFNPRSFVADPRCGNGGTSPAGVPPLYLVPPGAPAPPSLQSFIDCEVGNGDVPTGPNFIYNIFLAPSTMSADPFGVIGTCPVFLAYHYHGTIFGGAIFTAIFPACTPSFSGLMTSLTHEMVEATTDPFPPLSVITTGSGEIADPLGCGTSPFLAPFGGGAVSNYALTAGGGTGVCVPPFGSATAPAPTVTAQGWGPEMSITLVDHSAVLGPLPPVMNFSSNVGSAVSLPATTDLPYLSIQDVTRGWEAGNSLNGDVVVPNITSWDPGSNPITAPSQIQISGFLGPGRLQAFPGDQLNVTVCIPSYGQCGSGSTQLPSAPIITSLNPNQGPVGGGYSVTINGTGFGSTPQVQFGHTSIPILPGASDTKIVVTAPLWDPGPVDVQVLNSTLSNSPGPPATFYYCSPAVDSVDPASGPVAGGTAIKISGSCFAGATSVRFGDAGTVPATVNGSVISATSPPVSPKCATVDIQVVTPDRSGAAVSPESEADQFLYGDPRQCSSDVCNGPRASRWCIDDPCLRFNPPQYCRHLYPQVSPSDVPTDVAARPLNDLPVDASVSSAIRNVVSERIMPEVAPQRFAPEQLVTRGEFAAALTRAFELPTPPPDQPVVFTDVDVRQLDYLIFPRAQPYMTTDRGRGGAYTFHKRFPIERQDAAQTAVNIVVAAGKLKALEDPKQVDAALTGVKDRDRISILFRTYVATAIQNKLMAVDSKGVFNPNGLLTRAELASLITQIQNRLRNK